MLKNQVRIIAGKWRGRKISFPSMQGLRPTSDRTRETLFNWLMGKIENATCLDLFAGSGALGLEALSRGAKRVIFVDSSNVVIQNLQTICETLKAENQVISQSDAEKFVSTTTEKFDIVFMDPPFNKGLILPTIQLIEKFDILTPNAYIYLESESSLDPTVLPKTWKIIKSKSSRQVYYYLIQLDSH